MSDKIFSSTHISPKIDILVKQTAGHKRQDAACSTTLLQRHKNHMLPNNLKTVNSTDVKTTIVIMKDVAHGSKNPYG